MTLQFRYATVVTLLLALVLATFIGYAASRSATSATFVAQEPANKLTAADLKKLRWIEGTWRGTGDDVQPFFERYKFEKDTTLMVETFEDDTLSKVSDTTRYELKDGAFGGGTEGYRWAATAIDEKSISFAPVEKARNSFRWENVDKDSWKATLNWPATTEKPARERVYKMERWPPKTDF